MESCRHHWVLDSPDGGRCVAGTCLKCRETRNDFKASFDAFATMTGDDMHFLFAKKPDYSRWP